MRKLHVIGLLALVIMGAIVGCSEEGAPATTTGPGVIKGDVADAGSVIAPPADSGSVTTPPADAAVTTPPVSLECSDVVLPATIPAATGRFVQTAGAAAQTPPAQTGGDPTGDWALTGMTVYLPEVAALLINAESSTVGGKGWVSLRDGIIRMGMDTQLSLFVGNAPFITTPLKATAVGRYTVTGNEVVVDPICLEGAEDAPTQGMMLSIAPNNPFTVTGNTATVLFTFMLDAQAIKILVNLQRI